MQSQPGVDDDRADLAPDADPPWWADAGADEPAPRRDARRSRPRLPTRRAEAGLNHLPYVSGAIVLALLTALVLFVDNPLTGHALALPQSKPPATDSPSSTPGPSGPTAAQLAARKTIDKAVDSVPDGAAGIAALDLTTGKSLVAGSRKPMWTASVYKLLVLETLLRQDGPLDGSRLEQARVMIEQSDNKAGYALFLDGGGNPALRTTMRKFGMTHGRADALDPTFTKLTPSDALQMVRALTRPGALSADARAQALHLMRNVVPGQRWGVGVVADKGTTFANKNGWLSVDSDSSDGTDESTDDGGRWIVTSVGIATVHGHQVLLAAMTNHNANENDGIHAIERMARAAVVVLGDG